ncbi:MAG: TonB-dependent receptor plug domain-containing protein, partial [Bacteroidetes bacterium]|nr:TonB-dependent receptor plug domain-containing protein [Bacteroidota bacterium]
MNRCRVICLLAIGYCLLSLPVLAHAQGWGYVEGQVTEARDGLPLPGATIIVAGTDFGTAAQEDGRYRLRIPAGGHRLRFSAVGFTVAFDSVTVQRGATVRLDVALDESVAELEGLTVTDDLMGADAGVYRIDPQTMRDMPTPLQDGLRALKVMPGVASNNELSNQYSVRGGGFNENLIFINGFEVFLPFRPRQGEQEGLSLLNADLAERVTFYSGGFPVRYGGKLSSALEVEYYRPRGEPPGGRVHLSTLDAGASVGASALDGRLGYVLGIRRAEPGRFFGTQDLEGTYEPTFTDVQTFIGYELQPGHEIEFIGILADHEFRLDPSGSRTFFGSINLNPGQGDGAGLQSLWRDYAPESEQRDGYQTQFAGLRLANRLSSRLRIAHDVSFFGTEEHEFFDLR